MENVAIIFLVFLMLIGYLACTRRPKSKKASPKSKSARSKDRTPVGKKSGAATPTEEFKTALVIEDDQTALPSDGAKSKDEKKGTKSDEENKTKDKNGKKKKKGDKKQAKKGKQKKDKGVSKSTEGPTQADEGATEGAVARKKKSAEQRVRKSADGKAKGPPPSKPQGGKEEKSNLRVVSNPIVTPVTDEFPTEDKDAYEKNYGKSFGDTLPVVKETEEVDYKARKQKKGKERNVSDPIVTPCTDEFPTDDEAKEKEEKEKEKAKDKDKEKGKGK